MHLRYPFGMEWKRPDRIWIGITSALILVLGLAIATLSNSYLRTKASLQQERSLYSARLSQIYRESEKIRVIASEMKDTLRKSEEEMAELLRTADDLQINQKREKHLLAQDAEEGLNQTKLELENASIMVKSLQLQLAQTKAEVEPSRSELESVRKEFSTLQDRLLKISKEEQLVKRQEAVTTQQELARTQQELTMWKGSIGRAMTSLQPKERERIAGFFQGKPYPGKDLALILDVDPPLEAQSLYSLALDTLTRAGFQSDLSSTRKLKIRVSTKQTRGCEGVIALHFSAGFDDGAFESVWRDEMLEISAVEDAGKTAEANLRFLLQRFIRAFPEGSKSPAKP